MENTVSKIKIKDTSYIYYVQPENGVTFSYLSNMLAAQLSYITGMINDLSVRVSDIEDWKNNYDPHQGGGSSSGSNV